MRSPPRFDVAALEFAPRAVDDHLDAMAMNTEDALREYLKLFVRVPLVGRIGPLARTFDFVADAAPGVKEILGVGKLAYEVRERHYDLVVVDAEASGHIVAQVGAPQVIGDLIQVGMVRDQTRWMLDIIEDPARTGVVVVTTPEEMPVVETIELLDRLAAETASTSRRSSPTACCPRCSTARSPRSSAASDDADAAPRRRRRAGRDATSCSPPSSPRPGDVVGGRPPRAAAATPCRPAADPLRARAVHPGDGASGRRPRRRSARRGAGRGVMADATRGHAARRRFRAAWRRCWRARRWSSCAGPEASARPRWPPRSALAAAAEQGGKVLVLTVDPARRLADALGVGRSATWRRGCRHAAFAVDRRRRHAASCGRRCSTPRPAGTS